MRRLSAILSIDAVGYSRSISRDEARALAAFRTSWAEAIEPEAARHRGTIVKPTGDGALMEFASAVDAVQFAVAAQIAMRRRNAGMAEDQRIDFRVGINIGDIVAEGGDIFGDGVVIATRLEGQAEPGGICIHQNVRDQVRGKLALDFEDLGALEVKNIDRPVRAFQVIMNDRAEALAASSAASAAPAPRRGLSRLAQGAVGVALSLALLAGFAWWQPWAPEFEPVDPATMVQSLPAKPSIAVLALNDLNSGDDKDYLSDAIAEGIITELSRFSEFFVIARNSSFTYRDTATDVRTIARELGVHYVVEGSQQKAGDKLRVTVQLIDALAGNHIWAQTYDRDLADLFAVQDEIVREIASAVGGKVAFQPPPSGGLDKVSALHLNLQGRPFVRQWSKEGTLKALELNLAAVEADPDSPFGYIGLAFVYPRAEYGWLDLDGEEGLRRAEEAADRALALDPDNYDAHYARAFVHSRRGEHDRAIERYSRALELNPSAANVMASIVNPLMYKGRIDEALELMEQAVRLDPHHPDWFKWNLAWAQWAKGDCDSALATMQAMTNMPNRARRMLAVIQICLGRLADAEATVAKFLEKEPDYSIAALLKESEKRYEDKSLLDRYAGALREAGLPEDPPLALPDKPSIAVLAFDDQSHGDDKDYLSDAIAEGIITEFSRFPQLFVIARNSSFYYRDKTVDVRGIARELGVRYVLEGSQQKAGEKLRVTVQLIDAVAGNHVWAESYDRDLADLFRVQDEIAGAVASTVGGKLVIVASKEAARADPAQLRAFGYYLKGMKYWHDWTREANLRALESFEEAVDADPEMSYGHIGLAWAYMNGFRYGWTPVSREEALERARAGAQRGLELAPDDYFSLMSMAYVLMVAGESDEAIVKFREALERNPNSTDVMGTLAEQLGYVGQGEEAIALLEAAMRRDPHHPDWVKWSLGWVQYNMGQCEDALATMRKMSNLPSVANRTVAASHACLSQLEEARAAVDKLLASEPDYSIADVRAAMRDRMKIPGELERWLGHLREAGLPE